MSTHRQWIVAEPQPRARELASQTGLNPVVVQVLLNRGIDDPDALANFLDPQLSRLRDPAQLLDMDRAVARLIQALQDDELIGVYGDYDVDGVTSTALLCWALEQLGGRVIRHVPHRLLDGYGLSVEGLRGLHERGASLVIAVDCGVTAFAEIDAARALGLDVVVLDHHALEDRLPAAVAVVNPHRPGDGFGFPELAAVGLAFFFCVALRRALRERGAFNGHAEPDLRQVLDLVALGTVADQVPLVDQNRILVSAGLKVLQRGERRGLRALCDVARVDPERLQAGRLAFQLAPRINAAGRLGDAMAAVDLMLTDEPAEARSLAHVLDTANAERRSIEAKVFEQAQQHIAEHHGEELPAALVLGDPGWHPGVVGIVASRLVERYHRPALLVGTHGRGSGRSVPGFNLHEALTAVQEHLEGFGGHAQAVGMRVQADRLDGFRTALIAEAEQRREDADAGPTLQLDGQLQLRDVDLALAEALGQLAPFGRGNPEPTFAIDGVHFRSRTQVGGAHVRYVVEDGGHSVGGIAFHMLDRLHDGSFSDGARLAVVPEIDDWGGRRRLSLRTVDVLAPEADAGRGPDPGPGGDDR